MSEYKDLADSLNKEKDLIPRARRIFNNLSTIESILNRGITVNSLATVLSNNGFEITFEQLKNGIYQARKKKKQSGDSIESFNHQKTVITNQVETPKVEEVKVNQEEETENLTLKQRVERETNALFEKRANDISNNPFIKKLTKDKK